MTANFCKRQQGRKTVPFLGISAAVTAVGVEPGSRSGPAEGPLGYPIREGLRARKGNTKSAFSSDKMSNVGYDGKWKRMFRDAKYRQAFRPNRNRVVVFLKNGSPGLLARQSVRLDGRPSAHFCRLSFSMTPARKRENVIDSPQYYMLSLNHARNFFPRCLNVRVANPTIRVGIMRSMAGPGQAESLDVKIRSHIIERFFPTGWRKSNRDSTY